MKFKKSIFLSIISMLLILNSANSIAISASKKTERQKFIDSIKYCAINQYRKYNILPSLTIAQAVLESGNGKSKLSVKAKNLFGVKSKSSWKGKSYSALTFEYINGSKVSVVCNFKAYNTIGESIEDHSKILMDSRYYNVRKATDYKKACIAVQKCGYATAPDYASTLIDLIEKNNLQKYDDMAKQLAKR